MAVLSPHSIGHSLADATFGEPVSLSPSQLERHAYLLGATGAGKTNLVLTLLTRDIERRHSVVIVDLRGDLVERALALCASMDVPTERVSLLDLREPNWVVGFNPLSGCGEPFVRALHLVDTVRTESESWGVQLEETLRNSLLLLAHSGHTLCDLETLLFDSEFLRRCLDDCDEPAVIGFFERYAALSEERQMTFALPVLNKVTPLLATPGLRAVLGTDNPLNLEEILGRKGSIVLVALAVDELHRSSRMLGALIVSAIARIMCSRVQIPENKRTPVRLYVDEFEAMASESFEALIAEGRRFKLSLVLSHQNLAQLPAKLRSVVRNNVGLQILFRCGFQDAQELRRELPEGFTVDDLTGLNPGEMLLMPRGSDTHHAQAALSKVEVGAAQLMDYRSKILRRLGTKLSEVTAGMAEKKQSVTRLDSIQRPWGGSEDSWS